MHMIGGKKSTYWWFNLEQRVLEILIYLIGNIKWISDSRVKEKRQNLICKFRGCLSISGMWYIESGWDH